MFERKRQLGFLFHGLKNDSDEMSSVYVRPIFSSELSVADTLHKTLVE